MTLISSIDVSTYKDESDIFYEDPVKYLSTHFKPKATRVYGDDGLAHSHQHEKDSHIVFFEDLIRTHPDTPAWFENQGYSEVRKIRQETLFPLTPPILPLNLILTIPSFLTMFPLGTDAIVREILQFSFP